jgi:homoserine kinase
MLPVGLRVVVDVPATTANLGPGFDAYGLALDWRDRVALQIIPAGVQVEMSGEGADALPRDQRHLIIAALQHGLAALGVRAPGVHLECVNTIPHGRGLGSSSAAIVAGLAAARALAGQEPDRSWLVQHGSGIEGHPDNVAAAVYGGFVLAYTAPGPAGTEVAVAQLELHPRVGVVVLVPETPVATEAARGLLPEMVPHGDAAANAGRAGLLVHALAGDPSLLPAATADWLHQGYRAPAMPASYALLERLRAVGLAAVISGAGPSVLVLGEAADLDRVAAVEAPGFRRRRLGVGTEVEVEA